MRKIIFILLIGLLPSCTDKEIAEGNFYLEEVGNEEYFLKLKSMEYESIPTDTILLGFQLNDSRNKVEIHESMLLSNGKIRMVKKDSSSYMYTRGNLTFSGFKEYSGEIYDLYLSEHSIKRCLLQFGLNKDSLKQVSLEFIDYARYAEIVDIYTKKYGQPILFFPYYDDESETVSSITVWTNKNTEIKLEYKDNQFSLAGGTRITVSYTELRQRYLTEIEYFRQRTNKKTEKHKIDSTIQDKIKQTKNDI